MRNRALSVLVGVGLLVTSAGCTRWSAPAAGQAVSRETLLELAGRIQSELDTWHAAAQETDEHFPGATAAVILPDDQTLAFATGWSDVEQRIEMTADRLMPSGSIGKTYVAAVALSLSRSGALDLDAPASTWLGGEDWFQRVPNAAELTLRRLLGHTGGLIDHVFDSEAFARWARTAGDPADPDRYLTPREIVAFVLDTAPLFPAGAGYHYTDTGYVVAGLAIEAAAGESYYHLLERLFLGPMGLDLTRPATTRHLPGLAQGYAYEGSELFGTPLKMVKDGALVVNPRTEWTGGGLVNNPTALVRWAKALYEGDAIGGDGELDELLRVGYPADPGKPGDGYGLGVYVRQTPLGISYGHSGFFPGYTSQMLYFPDHRIAVAMQINADQSAVAAHTMALAEIVVQTLEPDI